MMPTIVTERTESGVVRARYIISSASSPSGSSGTGGGGGDGDGDGRVGRTDIVVRLFLFYFFSWRCGSVGGDGKGYRIKPHFCPKGQREL